MVPAKSGNREKVGKYVMGREVGQRNMKYLKISCCRVPLLSTTPTGLEKLIKSVKEHSDEKGLFLNIKKTKIMDSDKCKKEARIAIDGEEIERVSNCEYLGARIEANGKSTPEIRRRLAMATTWLTKMISIWKGLCKKNKTESPRDSIIPNCLVWMQIMDHKQHRCKKDNIF